jgi:hypothetical protein
MTDTRRLFLRKPFHLCPHGCFVLRVDATEQHEEWCPATELERVNQEKAMLSGEVLTAEKMQLTAIREEWERISAGYPTPKQFTELGRLIRGS